MNYRTKLQQCVAVPFSPQFFTHGPLYHFTHYTLHSQLNFPPFQVVFINTTSTYIRLVENHKVVITAKLSSFQGKMAQIKAPLHSKYSQLAKSMAYVIKSGGDFQQDGCLYKPSSGIQQTPKHLWTSDRPQKQASETSLRKKRPVSYWHWCCGNQLLLFY